jgi:phage FluMu protein Com
MLSSYQCPICKRSAVNMETSWRKLEEEIRRQPMPREFAEARAEVRCNDCNGRSVVDFHWLGCKCPRCDGFNTVEVRILAGEVGGDVESFAVARRERREVEQRARTFDLPVRPRHTERSVRVRPYFEEMDERDGVAVVRRPATADSAGFAMPALPHLPTLPNLNLDDMLARVSRGLSPIRHYFDGEIIDAIPSQFSGRDVLGEAETEWVDEGDWFEDSEEGSEEEGDSDEEGSGSEESDDGEGDDGGEEGGGERLNLNLLGHR